MSFFAIGIEHTKTYQNVGTLWRSADLMGAAYIFTIGHRYRRQSSDTGKAWCNVPLFHYDDVADMMKHLPTDTTVIGIELAPHAHRLIDFVHPRRACYILGAEDRGMSSEAVERCSAVVQLPGRRSMNVATAGSIVMYDRLAKGRK